MFVLHRDLLGLLHVVLSNRTVAGLPMEIGNNWDDMILRSSILPEEATVITKGYSTGKSCAGVVDSALAT